MSAARFHEAAALLRKEAEAVRRPYGPRERIDLAMADWLDVTAYYHAGCPSDCPATRVADEILRATVERVRELAGEWDRDAREHLNQFGQHMHASLEIPEGQLRQDLEGRPCTASKTSPKSSAWT